MQRITSVLALGLGCGLIGRDLLGAIAEDVVIDPDGAVRIRVVSAKSVRWVTCAAQWEGRLADIVSAVPPGHLITAPWRTKPNRDTFKVSLRKAMLLSPPAAFNPTRLRNTWLCWHLEHGTPLKELMEASDMGEGAHLHKLLKYLPETEPQRSSQLLRGCPLPDGGAFR